MANRWGNNGNSDRLYFGAPKSVQMVTAAMKLKDAPWKKSYDQPRQHKKQRHYFVNNKNKKKINFATVQIFHVILVCIHILK